MDRVSDCTITLHNKTGFIMGTCCDIKTLEGVMRGDPGDWIIRGIAGEIYPCKPAIFEKSYEPIDRADKLVTETGTNFAWVIEAGWLDASELPQYFAGTDGSGDGLLMTWSKDHADALRFARHEDAEKFSRQIIEPHHTCAWNVVEHGWAAPQTSGEKE